MHPTSEMKALVDAVTAVTSQSNVGEFSSYSYRHHFNGNIGPHRKVSHGAPPLRKRKHCEIPTTTESYAMPTMQNNNVAADSTIPSGRPSKSKDPSKARSRRLEQNRLAAIESRRRKKVMLEELKRSVNFYNKANANLKSQNDELQRQIIIAKQQVMVIESQQQSKRVKVDISDEAVVESCLKPEVVSPVKSGSPVIAAGPLSNDGVSLLAPPLPVEDSADEAQRAQFAATQALYKTMGYPPGAARAAASTFSQCGGLSGKAIGIPEMPSMPAAPKTNPATPGSILQDDAASRVSVESGTADEKTPNEGKDDTSAYIEALNKFAMQQAYAANAAAAAANAALQAAKFHSQMHSKDGAPASMPFFSFPFASNAPFSFPSLPAPPQSKERE